MSIKLFNIFILLCLFISSCYSLYDDEINEVISLQTKLEALNQSFYNVEKDKVNKAKKEYDKNIKQIKKYYFTDTVDVDFVQLMNTYKGIKKLTKSFAKDYNNISSNLITMKKQLENLKHDLEKNVFSIDSIGFFIEVEQNNINKLNENVSSFVIKCDDVIKIDDSLSSKVRSLINSYSE